MIIFLLIISAVITLIILIFSSKRLSPIPYYPSNKKDLELIVKALGLKNNQLIYDLGAGDGIIIFEAAQKAVEKKLNTKFVATEINPILLAILHLRRLFHANKSNIKIVKDDIFKMDFIQITSETNNRITIYLYISPWYLEKTLANIKSQLKNFKVVSYMYPVKSLRNKQKTIKGNKHPIYIYE